MYILSEELAIKKLNASSNLTAFDLSITAYDLSPPTQLVFANVATQVKWKNMMYKTQDNKPTWNVLELPVEKAHISPYKLKDYQNVESIKKSLHPSSIFWQSLDLPGSNER